MLSEGRSRKRWSQDPRNTFWSNDRRKYGYRMLQRMGWEEGRGLGVRGEGEMEHIKVSRKNDNLGVGTKKGRDDDWIEHQDAFDQLLQQLNTQQGCVVATPCSGESSKTLVDTAVESKKLVYKRFLRSKDLSLVSSQELDCVLGRKKRRQSSPLREDVVEKDALVTSDGITTVTRKQSVQDYFSSKQNSLQANNLQQSQKTKDEIIVGESSENGHESCSSVSERCIEEAVRESRKRKQSWKRNGEESTRDPDFTDVNIFPREYGQCCSSTGERCVEGGVRKTRGMKRKRRREETLGDGEGDGAGEEWLEERLEHSLGVWESCESAATTKPKRKKRTKRN